MLHCFFIQGEFSLSSFYKLRFLPILTCSNYLFFPPPSTVTHTHTHTLAHAGGECSGSGGRRAVHAGDDGAVQSAAEGAAATQSHSDRLPSLLWEGRADRRPGTVWHRSVQKLHRGELV